MYHFMKLPLRIVLPYALFGSLWIFFSDKALTFFVITQENIRSWSTCKGLFYVAITLILPWPRTVLFGEPFRTGTFHFVIQYMKGRVLTFSIAKNQIFVWWIYGKWLRKKLISVAVVQPNKNATYRSLWPYPIDWTSFSLVFFGLWLKVKQSSFITKGFHRI